MIPSYAHRLKIRKFSKQKGTKILYDWFECFVSEIIFDEITKTYKIVKELGKLKDSKNCIEIVENRRGKEFKTTLSADKFPSKDACIDYYKEIYGDNVKLIIE